MNFETGEVIANYPQDTPYSSRLVLGRRGARPVHVVVAENAIEDEMTATRLLSTAEQLAQSSTQVDVREYLAA